MAKEMNSNLILSYCHFVNWNLLSNSRHPWFKLAKQHFSFDEWEDDIKKIQGKLLDDKNMNGENGNVGEKVEQHTIAQCSASEKKR